MHRYLCRGIPNAPARAILQRTAYRRKVCPALPQHGSATGSIQTSSGQQSLPALRRQCNTDCNLPKVPPCSRAGGPVQKEPRTRRAGAPYRRGARVGAPYKKGARAGGRSQNWPLPIYPEAHTRYACNGNRLSLKVRFFQENSGCAPGPTGKKRFLPTTKTCLHTKSVRRVCLWFDKKRSGSPLQAVGRICLCSCEAALLTLPSFRCSARLPNRRLPQTPFKVRELPLNDCSCDSSSNERSSCSQPH